jgi:hypothetical protein
VIRRLRLAAAVALVLTAGAAPLAHADEPSWRLEQPRSPGSLFVSPLGAPGDLQFFAPNRGLLMTEGSTAPQIWVFNGLEWHQYSTVCGTDARHARVAWAGPDEFWTITEPSLPRRGAGASLCRFRNGEVAASYSTPDESPDPYREMNAATCSGPSDCWFGGAFAEDATGERRGAFHLHWDGATLSTVYGPQGRGVTDLETYAGTVFESVMVGRRVSESIDPDELSEPEQTPLLVHRIVEGRIVNDDSFTPTPITGVPRDGSELVALDSDGTQLWAGGGGAASGPSALARLNKFSPRPPLVARLDADGWHDIAIDATRFRRDDRIVDIAAVPGTDTAWAAVVPFSNSTDTTARAKVARISADGSVTVMSVPSTGPGRGQAAKIAFTSPNDGWLVTNAGWVFHFTDGSRPEGDTDPAFAGTITFRPNEAAEQFVPDRPPVDDSELFRPPPVEVETAPPPIHTTRLPALLRRIKSTRRGLRLIVRFTLVRRARVALIARRKGRVVARTRARMLRPGHHRLVLRLSRKHWPQRLAFSVHEPGIGGGGGEDGGNSGDTITTSYRPR